MKTMEERIFEQINAVKDMACASFTTLTETLYRKGLLTEEEYNSIINNN